VAERIHGPYQHRNRWRVVGVDASGSRIRQSFDRREDAQAFADTARSALGHRTVGIAVSAYLVAMATRARSSSVTTARYRLSAFLRTEQGDQLLAALTPTAARALYARRVAEVKPDTHRGELALVGAWGAWCVKQGWLVANPFEGVEPVGEKSRGKEQLRLDEARRFLSAAVDEGTTEGTACALALLTGARASEITDRIVRDLDDGGRLLWVPTAKTRAGVRQLAVPELLRARVLELARGKGPADRLWGDVTRHWLGWHVRRLCGVARVPVVSPHGLRGLYATLRVQSGAAVEAVARELGQAGPAVTRAHYLAPGTEGGSLAVALAERLSRD
jgi:integrase